MTKRIGFVIFDGLTALDLVGPFDTFAVANELASSRKNARAYDLVTVGLRRNAVVAESGMRFHPDTTILKAPALDTLVIPGGEGLRRADVASKISDWLQQRAPNTRRLVSICTGIYGLAYAGLLDDRRVSTQLALRFPNHTRVSKTQSRARRSLREGRSVLYFGGYSGGD